MGGGVVQHPHIHSLGFNNDLIFLVISVLFIMSQKGHIKRNSFCVLQHDGQPYCHKPCYAVLFGPKGKKSQTPSVQTLH